MNNPIHKSFKSKSNNLQLNKNSSENLASFNAKYGKQQALEAKYGIHKKKYYDDFLGMYVEVTVISKYSSGGENWLKLYHEPTDEVWIYVPKSSLSKERYIKLNGHLDKKLEEIYEEILDDEYQLEISEKLELDEWQNYIPQRQVQPAEVEKLLCTLDGKMSLNNKKNTDDIVKILNIDNIKTIDNILRVNKIKSQEQSLFDRITNTFKKLSNGINVKMIEVSPDLIKKVNQVVDLSNEKNIVTWNSIINTKNKDLEKSEKLSKELKALVEKVNKLSMEISQALAELEYAVIIAVNESEQLDKDSTFVLGAKGHFRSPNQKDTRDEELYGKLPPIGILNMEVDAYYRTIDGTLHVDEVKDSPSAFVTKIKEGFQIERQIKWVKQSVVDPKTVGCYYKKEVGYFIRALRDLNSLMFFQKM